MLVGVQPKEVGVFSPSQHPHFYCCKVDGAKTFITNVEQGYNYYI